MTRFILWMGTIASAAAGGIDGRVVDLLGAAIAAATLTLSNSAGAIVATTVTRQDGFFELQQLPAGPHHLLVHVPGFKDERLSVIVPSESRAHVTVGMTLARITDSRPVVIEGVVRNKNGNTEAGATVWVRSTYTREIRLRVETDGQGRYRVSLEPIGPIEVVATKGPMVGAVQVSLGEEPPPFPSVDVVLDMTQ